MGRYITKTKARDLKVDGFWKQSYIQDGILNITRSFSIWNSMVNRVNRNEGRSSSYSECSIAFEGYQEFTEWCNNQEGYTRVDEKGKHWSLDKDILVPFNKVYSPEACCFVPARVNTCLTARSKDRGSLPLGVSADYGRGNCDVVYLSHCCIDGKQKNLGRRKDPLSAHKLWQQAKIKELEKLKVGMAENVIDGLTRHIDLIKNDILMGIETKR